MKILAFLKVPLFDFELVKLKEHIKQNNSFVLLKRVAAQMWPQPSIKTGKKVEKNLKMEKLDDFEAVFHFPQVQFSAIS